MLIRTVLRPSATSAQTGLARPAGAVRLQHVLRRERPADPEAASVAQLTRRPSGTAPQAAIVLHEPRLDSGGKRLCKYAGPGETAASRPDAMSVLSPASASLNLQILSV